METMPAFGDVVYIGPPRRGRAPPRFRLAKGSAAKPPDRPDADDKARENGKGEVDTDAPPVADGEAAALLQPSKGCAQHSLFAPRWGALPLPSWAVRGEWGTRTNQRTPGGRTARRQR